MPWRLPATGALLVLSNSDRCQLGGPFMTLQDLEARFAAVGAEPAHYQDQQLGMVACQEALVAAQRGNYGVGAVLVNPGGSVVSKGQNTVFYPHFRSDLHAEMVVMNAFEERHPEVDSMRG